MAAVTRPEVAAYSAAKAGLNGLVRALAVELAPVGITANAIAPGYVHTDGNSALRAARPGFEGWIAGRTPVGRWAEPDEIAPAALYLASDAARYVTGSVITVDGGLTAAI
jgi:gluconate 5-dehydrogenase